MIKIFTIENLHKSNDKNVQKKKFIKSGKYFLFLKKIIFFYDYFPQIWGIVFTPKCFHFLHEKFLFSTPTFLHMLTPIFLHQNCCMFNTKIFQFLHYNFCIFTPIFTPNFLPFYTIFLIFLPFSYQNF